MAAKSPTEEAERILRRFDVFRAMGLTEEDAQAFASSEINFAEVVALVRRDCPLHLLVRILL